MAYLGVALLPLQQSYCFDGCSILFFEVHCMNACKNVSIQLNVSLVRYAGDLLHAARAASREASAFGERMVAAASKVKGCVTMVKIMVIMTILMVRFMLVM